MGASCEHVLAQGQGAYSGVSKEAISHSVAGLLLAVSLRSSPETPLVDINVALLSCYFIYNAYRFPTSYLLRGADLSN